MLQEHKFDEILDYLCSGIMVKSERESVRNELFDHLMCKYETNLAVGMDEEKAKASAINDLGDKGVLKFKLSQVHSYFPKLSMKNAMTLLICGYVLMSVHINIFDTNGEFKKFIGSVLMFVAMFCLAKASKTLKNAFAVSCAHLLINAITVIATPYINNDYVFLIYTSNILMHILNILRWYFLFSGLKKLTHPYAKNYKRFLFLNAAIVMNVIAETGVLIMLITGIATDDFEFLQPILNYEPITQAIYKDSFLLFLFGILVTVTVVVTFIAFYRASSCLMGSDHEYKIEDSTAKKVLAGFLSVMLTVVPSLTAEILTATQKAETSVYSIYDTDISKEEYNRICNNLLSYGVPEKLVYCLPESEIEKFSDSVSLDELNLDERILENIKNGELPICSKDSFYINNGGGIAGGAGVLRHICAIGMLDESGHPYVRLMLWLEYPETLKSSYTDYLVIGNSDRLIPFNSPEENNGDEILILSEENGVTLKNEPLNVWLNNEQSYLVDSVKAVTYQAKPGMIFYYASTYGVDSNKFYQIPVKYDLYHRNFPVTNMSYALGEKTNYGITVGFNHADMEPYYYTFCFENEKN